jgi:hypothetical protein
MFSGCFGDVFWMFRRCFLDVMSLSERLSFSDAWEHYPRFNEVPSRSLMKELFVTHYVTPDGFIFGDFCSWY